MKPYLHLIDNHTPGPRDDVTPLFASHAAFSALVDDLLILFNAVKFDYVAGIDALGFILGAGLALRAGVGFVAIRKGGKLPVLVDSVSFVDYSGQTKSLEMRRNILTPGAAVLLVDEWIETGSQMRAAAKLVEQQGGVVAGIATINMDDNENTRRLAARYRCHCLQREGV